MIRGARSICTIMYDNIGICVYKKARNARGLGSFAYTGRTYAYFSYTHKLLSGRHIRHWVSAKQLTMRLWYGCCEV